MEKAVVQEEWIVFQEEPPVVRAHCAGVANNDNIAPWPARCYVSEHCLAKHVIVPGERNEEQNTRAWFSEGVV